MASEEQYLDDLLNNAINSEPKERSMKDVMRKMGIVIEEPETVVEEPAPVEQMNQDELDAMLAGLDLPEEPVTEEPAVEEEIPATDDISMDEIPAMEEELPASEDTISDIDNPTDDDLLKMLGEATTAEDFVMPESRMTAENEEPNSDEASQDDLAAMLGESSQDDLAAMLGESSQDDLAAMLGDSSQDDLAAMLGEEATAEPKADLNDVEKLEATGESDEDLLALLEGIDPTASGETSEDSSGEISELLSEPDQIIEPYDADGKLPKPKKKFKGFSLPFFGKKKKKAEIVEGNIDDGVIAGTADEIDNILAGMEQAENPDNDGVQEIDLAEAMGDLDELAGIKEKKKPGFFARLLAFLTEDLDEPDEEVKPMEEFSNDDILAEVDAEAAVEEKKAEKKSKKSKKDKKKKGAAAEPSEDGEGEEGDEAAEDTSKKKKNKEKKVKEPKEPKPKEPKKIVHSKKANIGLFAFCVTLIAAIVILSNILPDYTQKLEARKAYYQGDYRTVYANFMNKQLNDSDTIIFKRAETIMKLQRRLDSYNNRIAMGQEAEALDSLFEGVYVYQKLINDDTVDVANDLIPIYSQITEILKNKYGISSDEALQIYNIDDDTEYTRILFEIVRTGSYSLTTEPQEDELPLMEPSVEEENESVDENTENTSEDVSTDDSMDDSEYTTIELEDMLPGEEDLL